MGVYPRFYNFCFNQFENFILTGQFGVWFYNKTFIAGFVFG